MNYLSGVKNPSITVLMSVYNGERWLEEAMQSVLNQTHTDFEFIVINDGSSDRSLNIINRFSEYDRRIVVINKPNTGLGDSLNLGINLAKGEWIARIDADDVCEPDRLKKQYALAKMESSLVLIGSGLQLIDENGHFGKYFKCPSEHKQLFKRLATAKSFFSHSSAFFRTETVKMLGGYRTRIKRAQDRDLWLRLAEVGQIACLSEPLVKIRKHASQISHDEQGLRQKIDSRVAITSFWFRHRGLVDPVSAAYSDEDFEIFREWVVDCLRQDRLFEYSAFIQQVKQELFDYSNSFEVLLKITALLLREPAFVLRYFRQALVGEQLPKSLVARWEQKIKTCT